LTVSTLSFLPPFKDGSAVPLLVLRSAVAVAARHGDQRWLHVLLVGQEGPEMVPKIARRDPATGEGCQIRLAIKLSNDAVVKSAFPIIVQPCPQPVSAPRR
jgi:hypothetical protein